MENEEKIFFALILVAILALQQQRRGIKLTAHLPVRSRRGLVSELYLVRERPGLSNERERERERKKKREEKTI